MKQKKERILPLEMTDLFIKNDPNVWEKLYDDEGNSDITKVKKYCKEMEYSDSSSILYALAEWRRHKMIFSFDRDLIDVLLEADSLDDEIPGDILSELPYNSIYIRLPEKLLNVPRLKTKHTDIKEKLYINGFFFYIDYPIGAFVIVFEDCRTISIAFTFKNGVSLRQSMNEMLCPNEDTLKLGNMLL